MKDFISQKLHEYSEMNEHGGELTNYMFFNNLKKIHEATSALLQMNPQEVDEILTDGHNWALDHIAVAADDIDQVHHFMEAVMGEEDVEDTSLDYDGETEIGYHDEHGSVEDAMMNEAEYKGKTVTLGKPMKGDVKKYKVFVKNKKGNVVKVNFGDKNMEIKRDNPKRRKSFRARHKCSQAHDRTTPKYWSCKMWSKTPVSKMVGESFDFSKGYRILERNDTMNNPNVQPITKPETKPTTKPAPGKKDSPFLPKVTPGVQPDPKAINENMRKYEIYHKTLASVVDEMNHFVLSRGFDEINWGMGELEHVNYGTTKRLSKELNKDGMPTKYKLIAQIYRLDSGNYELNMYLNF